MHVSPTKTCMKPPSSTPMVRSSTRRRGPPGMCRTGPVRERVAGSVVGSFWTPEPNRTLRASLLPRSGPPGSGSVVGVTLLAQVHRLLQRLARVLCLFAHECPPQQTLGGAWVSARAPGVGRGQLGRSASVRIAGSPRRGDRTVYLTSSRLRIRTRRNMKSTVRRPIPS